MSLGTTGEAMRKRGRREENANSNDGREADPSFKTNKTFVMIIKNRNLSWETIDFPNACVLF